MKKVAYVINNELLGDSIESKIKILCELGVCRNDIYVETITEFNSERPEKERMLTHIFCEYSEKTTVVVFSIADLGRYNNEIKNSLQKIFESGAELISVNDCIDTTNSEILGSHLKTVLVAVFQNLADKDRAELTMKQTKGRKMTDKKLGRPSFEPTDYFLEDCKDLQNGLITRDEILKKYSITRSTFYKYRAELLDNPVNMTQVDRMRFFE